MEIGLAQHVSNKIELDVPTDAAHLFTVIEEWYWTLGSYKNTVWGPSNAVGIYHHSDGLKYKVEPGQHILGLDINGQTVGNPETFFRGLLHIDAIELTPQLTRLWLIPKSGFDDLASKLTAFLKEAYGLNSQHAEASAGNSQVDFLGRNVELSYLEKKILTAVQSLRDEGCATGDEYVAARLPTNSRGKPYTREWINKKRNAMRKRGIDV